jgi:predicted alpha/beta-hydrolase family hydrolase
MLENINVGRYAITADVSIAKDPKFNVVIAHGANNDMHNDIVSGVFKALAPTSSVIRFNFSFVAGNERVDHAANTEELKACIRRLGGKNIVLIGKSYGGYLSILVASEKAFDIKSVIVLGFPLHSMEEDAEVERYMHVGKVKAAITFINGDSDPYCRREAFERALPGYKCHWIKEADHSFRATGAGLDEDNTEKVVSLVKEVLSVD